MFILTRNEQKLISTRNEQEVISRNEQPGHGITVQLLSITKY